MTSLASRLGLKNKGKSVTATDEEKSALQEWKILKVNFFIESSTLKIAHAQPRAPSCKLLNARDTSSYELERTLVVIRSVFEGG